MGSIATSWVQQRPSFVEPGILIQYNQVSGAFRTLATGQPLVKIGSEDLGVYIKHLDIRTVLSAGQQAYNNLPSVAITATIASTPTYLLRCRAEYDHHDTAALAMFDAPIVDAFRLGMRQAHFQVARNALLYGMNPANGEGLLNANGATTINLPPDSNGNDTVRTYDNGQMAFFLLSQIQTTKVNTNQLGIPHRFVVLGPQRVLGSFEWQNIVELVQYQRAGAGSQSTAGVVKDVAAMNGDTIEWVYDDTLIGAGSGGADAVLIVMPEVDNPNQAAYSTNEFAKLTPSIAATTLMYTDMAAPMEITTPIPGGAVDVLSEMRITSGWGIRPEAINVISMTY